MSKLINNDNLNKLAKALDARHKTQLEEEKLRNDVKSLNNFNSLLYYSLLILPFIVIGWVVKPKWVIDEVESSGAKFGRKRLYTIMIKYIAPALMVILFFHRQVVAVAVVLHSILSTLNFQTVVILMLMFIMTIHSSEQ